MRRFVRQRGQYDCDRDGLQHQPRHHRDRMNVINRADNGNEDRGRQERATPTCPPKPGTPNQITCDDDADRRRDHRDSAALRRRHFVRRAGIGVGEGVPP